MSAQEMMGKPTRYFLALPMDICLLLPTVPLVAFFLRTTQPEYRNSLLKGHLHPVILEAVAASRLEQWYAILDLQKCGLA
jgi:hypothetical protein